MSIFPINDDRDQQRLKSLKTEMLDEPAHFDGKWVSARGWIVVPIESALHFEEDDAEKLSCAFDRIGSSEVFAIATEALKEFPNYFLVATSKQGLLDFSHRCALFNFVLTPGSRSCAVLCTVYDYYLVAGPSEFVRIAVGGDIDEARRRFDEVAADPWWEGRLARVADRYRGSSSLASN